MISRRFIAITVVTACCLPACSSVPEDIASEQQPFATALAGEPVHEEITASALDFLRTETLTAIQAANVSVDVEFVLVNSHHFDDCNFSGGADVVRGYQAEAVAALNPSIDPIEGDARAILAFGRWLHTVQDFYAHSNWVESGENAIVEGSLSAWPAWAPYDVLAPSGMVLVQGKPAPGTNVTRNEDAPYPEDAIVRVKTKTTIRPGLMTGTVDYEPGNFCPPSIAMTHADLNKDHSDTPGREAEFAVAESLAVTQTLHEWCRLMAMARAAWGDAGPARLLTWTADPARASCTP